MKTIEEARRECVAELRRRASVVERSAIGLVDRTEHYHRLALRDAYLEAAEIVQSCFAGLELPEGFPPGRDPSARATLERITPIVDPQVHAALEDVEYYSTGGPDFLDKLVDSATAQDPNFPAKLAAARARRQREREGHPQ